ncbi:uncharacterized protein DUF1353 [Prosthecobacter fusiformis]|uniref:Uncharacterized protein DUF1353 n=1 Tax=Prosthecobacter fusiformis TaxID=48464 RepID=A0A4R7RJC9_9BACT|nr:DUF1353 domain-containing protein [Prosthecobacter fusiformis]TDU64109.1 uncharacterized protein DUF1353 [Prosthecobacter fusiformis]
MMNTDTNEMDGANEGRGPRIIPLRDAALGFGLLPRFLCRWVRGPLWRLGEDYEFILAAGPDRGRVFRIPKGYEFDKASVPPLLWGPPFNYLPDGLCTLPALEHDFLCDLLAGGSAWLRMKLVVLPVAPPAGVVHEHFRERLHQSGVRGSKAEAMGRAVSAFGPQGKAYPWNWWR